jgi:hypothetical protein
MTAWKKPIELVESRFAVRKYALELTDADSKVTLADLLNNPAVWVDSANGPDGKPILGPGDLIRVIGQGLDVQLVVRSVIPRSGVQVEVYGERSKPGTKLGNQLLEAERRVRQEELELLAAQVRAATNGAAEATQ